LSPKARESSSQPRLSPKAGGSPATKGRVKTGPWAVVQQESHEDRNLRLERHALPRWERLNFTDIGDDQALSRAYQMDEVVRVAELMSSKREEDAKVRQQRREYIESVYMNLVGTTDRGGNVYMEFTPTIALRMVSMGIPESRVAECFDRLDIDRQGEVTLAEFTDRYTIFEDMIDSALSPDNPFRELPPLPGWAVSWKPLPDLTVHELLDIAKDRKNTCDKELWAIDGPVDAAAPHVIDDLERIAVMVTAIAMGADERATKKEVARAKKLKYNCHDIRAQAFVRSQKYIAAERELQHARDCYPDDVDLRFREQSLKYKIAVSSGIAVPLPEPTEEAEVQTVASAGTGRSLVAPPEKSTPDDLQTRKEKRILGSEQKREGQEG